MTIYLILGVVILAIAVGFVVGYIHYEVRHRD